jgi:hypothetical protein
MRIEQLNIKIHRKLYEQWFPYRGIRDRHPALTSYKVKLSLYLTKLHDMKTYPVLNQAQRDEDV